MRKLLNLVLSLSVSLMTVSASAGIRVVSDIDDTAKITNVGSPAAAVWNGLFSNRAFTGMRELYGSFAVGKGYAFSYLSGSPDFLKFRAKQFLKASGFPEGELYLRPTGQKESLRAYKVRVIREILQKYPDDRLLLIGDDTQADFDAYDDIFRYAPDRIVAVYIRKVTNRKLPPSVYPFLSAFDLARTEYIMGRFSVTDMAPVAISILSERRMSRIVPSFSYCPVNAFFSSDEQVERWNRDIDSRIQEICQSRSLLPEI